MTVGTLAIRASQAAFVIACSGAPTNTPRITAAPLVIAVGPPQSRAARAPQLALVIACSGAPTNTPRITAAPLVLATITSPPQTSLSLAWTFTLDGHTLYVLNLGNVGTYVYDTVTQQWSNFSTQGYDDTWNFLYGNMWGTSRIVGVDTVSPILYELDPSAVLDEGWRGIEHIVTGILAARNRVAIRVDNVRITGSAGDIDDTTGATLIMKYSDDNGATWSQPFPVALVEGKHYEISYRSLGSFKAPGRIFQFCDVGGLIRIDGADVFLNSWDEATGAPGQQPAGQQGPGNGQQ